MTSSRSAFFTKREMQQAILQLLIENQLPKIGQLIFCIFQCINLFHFTAGCIPYVFRQEITHGAGRPCCFAPAFLGPSIGGGAGLRTSFSEGRSPVPEHKKDGPFRQPNYWLRKYVADNCLTVSRIMIFLAAITCRKFA